MARNDFSAANRSVPHLDADGWHLYAESGRITYARDLNRLLANLLATHLSLHDVRKVMLAHMNSAGGERYGAGDTPVRETLDALLRTVDPTFDESLLTTVKAELAAEFPAARAARRTAELEAMGAEDYRKGLRCNPYDAGGQNAADWQRGWNNAATTDTAERTEFVAVYPAHTPAELERIHADAERGEEALLATRKRICAELDRARDTERTAESMGSGIVAARLAVSQLEKALSLNTASLNRARGMEGDATDSLEGCTRLADTVRRHRAEGRAPAGWNDGLDSYRADLRENG